jgi:hypothetical protein
MKNYKTLVFSTLLALSATPLVRAKESPPEEIKNYSGISYTLNPPDAPEKYHAYFVDCTDFDTDVLPPEGVVAGATMKIIKGDGQKLKRIKDQDDPILTARFAPLQVSIKNSAGKPLKNVRVLFEVDKTNDPCQAVQIAADGPQVVYVMTDKRGVATLSLRWNHSTSNYDIDRKKKREKAYRKLKFIKSDTKMKRDKSVEAYHMDGPFSILATYGENKVCFHLTVGGS